MRKLLPLIVWLIPSVAYAQLGIGINHDASLKGTGSTASPLGVRADCTTSDFLLWNGSAWVCSGYVAGDITAVTAGSGLTGGGASGAVTLDIGAGTGITVAADSISVNTAVIQARVSGTCSGNDGILSIAADGSVTCATGTGDITAVTAGTGLSGGGSSGAVSLAVSLNGGVAQSCSAGDAIVSLSATGIVTCDTAGITNSAGVNVIMKSDGTNAVGSSWTDDGTTTAYNTNKFTIAAATGNTVVGGNLTAGSGSSSAHSLTGSITQTGNSGSADAFTLNSSPTGSTATRNAFVINRAGTFDTTVGALDSFGGKITVSSTRSGGGNAFRNYALQLDASGAVTSNVALRTNAGDNWLNVGSGNTAVGYAVGSAPSAKFAVNGAAQVDGVLYVSNQINGDYNVNALGYLLFNYTGYQGGTTQFRDSVFYDGKQNEICRIAGAAATLNCVGGLQENGTAVLSGAITDNVIPKGSSGDLADSSWTDNGTTSTTTGALDLLGGFAWIGHNNNDGEKLKLGNDSNSTTGADQGMSFNSSRSGAVFYWDTKLATGGAIVGRIGAGTNPGYTNNWLQVDGSGNASFYGSTTLGDNAAVDTTTINGVTTINGAVRIPGLATTVKDFEIAKTAATTWHLTTRDTPSTYPAAVVRASQTDTVLALDLMPNGVPSIGSGGYTWFDSCDADLWANSAVATHCARVGIDGSASFGSVAFNGAAERDLRLHIGGTTKLNLSTTAANLYTTLSITPTSGNAVIDGVMNQNTGSWYKLTNTSSGTGAYAKLEIANDVSTGVSDLFTFGTGYTTNGGLMQDSTVLYAGAGLSNGLNLIAGANAPVRIYTGGFATSNLRMMVDGSGSLFAGDTASTSIANNVDVVTIGNTGTGQTTTDKSELVVTNTGSYNTTSGDVTHYAANIATSATESAGTNTFKNVALRLSATGGDTVQGLWVDDGATQLDSTLNVDGAATVHEFRGTVLSPSAISGTVNDYNPTNLSTATTLVLTPSASTTLTGIAGGADGRRLNLCHSGANFDVILKVEDTNSTDVNRFAFDSFNDDHILVAALATCVQLEYRTSDNRWHLYEHVSQHPYNYVSSSEVLYSDATLYALPGATGATASSCGTTPDVTGTNVAGVVTIGSGTATSCTVNFPTTWSTTAPSCVISSEIATRGDLVISAKSTSAFTVTSVAGANLAGGVFDYHCIGVAMSGAPSSGL